MIALLRGRMRSDLFERWILPLRATDAGGEIVLDAPDPFHRNFVDDNYRKMLEALALTAPDAAQQPSFRIRFVAPESTVRPSGQ